VDGGRGGAGGDGGDNSADQAVITTADLSFEDSFTDDDGLDFKGAEIEDSFNSDDDGVDNSGGRITDSNVAGGDQTDVGNSVEITDIDDSFNTDESETTVLNNVGNDYSDNSTTVRDSFNDESTDIEVDLEDIGNTDNSVDIGGDFDPDLIDVDVSDVLNDLDLGDVPVADD
jgi:hypothetical protein